jgi:hypothetical protein
MRSRYRFFEVIVVDNNSTDRSLEILRHFRNSETIKLVLLRRNVHFARANNIGIHQSKGKFLVFLNNDTKVDEAWLDEILSTFNKNDKIAAVQCMVLSMAGRDANSKGGTLDYSGRLLPVDCLWQTDPSLESERRIFWGTGAALVIRKSILDSVGAFDPSLPTDEVDLCWRINLSGGKIVLAPTAKVYHYGSASFGSKLNSQRLYYAEISMLTAVLRNFDRSSLLHAIYYFTSFLPMAAASDIIIRRRVDVLLFRLMAYFHILGSLRKIFSQRRFVQNRIRKVHDTEIKRLMVKPNPLLYYKHFQKT